MSLDDVNSLHFTLDDCKILADLDSIIAQTVHQLEEDRALEESEQLAALEKDSIIHPDSQTSTKTTICKALYEKYVGLLHKRIDPKIYLLLGHFQLLLNRLEDALSAYLKYESLVGQESLLNCGFLYGLGHCCYNFAAFNRAVELFQRCLYLQPSFPRFKEIQIRIAYFYKTRGSFDKALKHFRQALNDSTPGTFSHIELRFHIAHIFELSGKAKQAKSEYLELSALEDVPGSKTVRHLSLRQLAWLHHTGAVVDSQHNSFDSLGEPSDTDVQWLNKAIDLDTTNGNTWYLLGRCQAALNRVQQAFQAYRSSIDKTEASADTWCSIGVLYQEQGQPMDALQAYFCAVQLDKCHVAAWANLGTLYESVQQYHEALKCYRNAVSADKKNVLRPEIHARFTLLKEVVPHLPPVLFNSLSPSGSPALPTVDEAWSLPIPHELTQRQMNLSSLQESVAPTSLPNAKVALNTSSSGDRSGGQSILVDSRLTRLLQTPTSFSHKSVASQRKRPLDSSGNANNQSCQPPSPIEDSTTAVNKHALPFQRSANVAANSDELTLDQMSTLKSLQLQETTLTPSQRHLLSRLQAQALHSYLKAHTSSSPTDDSPHACKIARPDDHQPATSSLCNKKDDEPVSSKPPPPPVTSSHRTDDPSACEPSPSSVGGSGHLRDDYLDFFTEDELSMAQFNRPEAGTLDLVEMALFSTPPVTSSTSTTTPVTSTATSTANQPSTTTTVKTDAPSSPLRMKDESVDLYFYLTKPLVGCDDNSQIPARVDIRMSAKQVCDAVADIGRLGMFSGWTTSILPEGSPPPQPPVKPYPPPDDKGKLNPPTPTIYLESRKDAQSPDLARYCMSQPVVVVRDLAVTLRLDLGLFSTKSLQEANPDHRIEVRKQLSQPPDVNKDAQGRTVWLCESSRTATTMSKYAAYQAASFTEGKTKQKQQSLASSNSFPLHSSSNDAHDDVATNSIDGQLNPTDVDNSSNCQLSASSKTDFIRFGTNCDLSDEKKWPHQLHELMKLPPFFRVVSGFNMLSHVGYSLLGMNTVQLYMKVPGSRTPGHQENNNFCSVNINTGPGDCEWFCVPEQYWGAIHRLCIKNEVDYLSGSWWPDLECLSREAIPVYRFIQRPGDLVWINSGTVHWVQAVGWCNNIAWNVGPLSARQYQLAVERYEFNRLSQYKSIVPMIHLSWQLARNVKLTDPGLFELVKHTLMRSIARSKMTADFLDHIDVTVKYHGKSPDDVAHSCHDCEIEVFNYLFVLSQDKKFVVRCFNCARRMDPALLSFTVLTEYHLDQLMEAYDTCQLQTHPMIAQPVSKT